MIIAAPTSTASAATLRRSTTAAKRFVNAQPQYLRHAIIHATVIGAALLPATLFALPLSNTVSLSGNTFTWSDEGWYQVQDSTNYNTICGGGSNCTVEPGTYHVINHSTGVRLEFVTVPADEPSTESVTVAGNTISWPDDGWYQVQDSQSYASLCQGGLSCNVPSGEYIVINHTSGERHTGIVVSDSASGESAAINRDNYLDMLVQAFEVYMGTAYDDRMPTQNMDRLATDDYTETREPGPMRDQTIVNLVYACQNGGEVDREFHLGISPDIFFSYTADNCQYQDEVISGKWSVSGYRIVSHSNIILDDFSIMLSPEGELKADGGYRLYAGYYGYANTPYDYTQYWRTDELDYSFSYAGGTLVIEDATTLGWYGYIGYTFIDDERTWYYKAQMEGDFDMKPPFQPETTVSASTPIQFNESRLGPKTQLPPYVIPPLPRFETGELLLSADDGSTVRLNADNGDVQSALVTIENGDGEETFDLDWTSLDAALAMRSFDLSWPRE